jgi:Tol biopolymer transport system component/predicted Ser/Thr protein kinase
MSEFPPSPSFYHYSVLMLERVGQFEVLRELGRGGMGVVYLARDTRLNREVAIKALPVEMASDPARLERFEREARTLAGLSHPNIAGIYGVEEQDGAKYLVLEFVEGETLADMLDRGPLPVDDAIELAVQIAAGVEAAHEAGVVHRDLKPANIIVTPDGQAKVLDFGLARTDEPQGSSSGGLDSPTMTTPQPQHSPTIAGAILGTAAYMSPEQARGRKVDKRTDIWSFGVVLYEMLVGASPFHGETVSDSIGAVLHKNLDLDRLPAGTPDHVRRVLARCLERDKNYRYRDIGDVRIELQSPVAGVGPSIAPRRRTTTVVTMAALVLLTVVTGAGWVWSVLRPGEHAPSAQIATMPTLRLTIPMPDGLEITGPIAISRDGSQVAYSAISDEGEQHVYVRRLDGFDPIRVDGSRDGYAPFFSPDGASIGFRARNAIWRAATNGGPPTRLVSVMWMAGADWMDDDTIIYNAGIDSPIRRMTSGGVPLDPITDVSDTGSYAHAWPQRIPGSDRVLFTAWGQAAGRTAGGHIADLSTGAVLPLVDQSGSVAPGRWSASGHILFEQFSSGLSAAPFDPTSAKPMSAGTARLLLGQVHHLGTFSRSVFALSDNGVMAYVPRVSNARRLVRVEPDGSTRTILEQSEIEYTSLGGNIAISGDGRQALTGGSAEIVLIDLERGIPRRITFDGNSTRFPAWSHDETHVYFLSSREERWKIWSVPTDQSAPPELLIEHEHQLMFFSVGPSGEVVFGVQNPVTNRDIWIRDPDGAQRPLLQTPYDELNPNISPDGRFVAYDSNVSGTDEVYIIPASGRGVAVQVTSGGGTSPKWSRDGSALMFRKGRTIMRVAVEDGRPFGDAARVFAAPNLTSSDKAYELDPDGQSMLAIQVDADTIPREIRVITNFFDEIRRVAGDGAVMETKP